MPRSTPRRVLHVGAEIYPLIKTGGLADVLGALPSALASGGTDVRLLLPGYPALLHALRVLFPKDLLPSLLLPEASFVFDGLEFHGQGSAIKAGLQYADHITTVSPTYAREIQTAEFGCGLDTVIAHRRAVLSGILNGVDHSVWNPANDPLLEARFDPSGAPAQLRAGKARAKQALQRQLGLEPVRERLLLG